jgi:hypothetical protein
MENVCPAPKTFITTFNLEGFLLFGRRYNGELGCRAFLNSMTVASFLPAKTSRALPRALPGVVPAMHSSAHGTEPSTLAIWSGISTILAKRSFALEPVPLMSLSLNPPLRSAFAGAV